MHSKEAALSISKIRAQNPLHAIPDLAGGPRYVKDMPDVGDNELDDLILHIGHAVEVMEEPISATFSRRSTTVYPFNLQKDHSYIETALHIVSEATVGDKVLRIVRSVLGLCDDMLSHFANEELDDKNPFSRREKEHRIVHRQREAFACVIDETTHMIERIAQATLKSPAKKHALSKLQSLRFGQRGDNHANEIAILLPFTAIPTVQYITGINMHLETLNGATSERSKHFGIDGNNAHVETFHPDWIVNALILYAQETLEELCSVVWPNWEIVEHWNRVLNVTAFKRLKVLEVESGMLCEGEEARVVVKDARQLVDILLRMLEKLTLRHLRKEQARVLFNGFQEGKRKGHLMELTKVVLRNPDKRNDTVAAVEVVRRACEETGVVVDVKEEMVEFPFFEAEMESLVEPPTICASYPKGKN
ncbi:hypothetical protein N431DRAFT_444522 [Stipitochalara longipes BDJ]|nr:hypothetical protein N431DRAFT_444522 [Stipitochalara longipes BDJ]